VSSVVVVSDAIASVIVIVDVIVDVDVVVVGGDERPSARDGSNQHVLDAPRDRAAPRARTTARSRAPA
jgi:hypothetical protein